MFLTTLRLGGVLHRFVKAVTYSGKTVCNIFPMKSAAYGCGNGRLIIKNLVQNRASVKPLKAKIWTGCFAMASALISAPASAENTERILIPIAFSTPDTGFAGGAAVIWVIPNPAAGENKNDTVRTFGFISQKGQMMLAVGSSLYRDSGSILLEPSVSFGKSYDSSYGFASESKAAPEKP